MTYINYNSDNEITNFKGQIIDFNSAWDGENNGWKVAESGNEAEYVQFRGDGNPPSDAWIPKAKILGYFNTLEDAKKAYPEARLTRRGADFKNSGFAK